MAFSTLPYDCLDNIMSFLPIRDRMRSSCACKDVYHTWVEQHSGIDVCFYRLITSWTIWEYEEHERLQEFVKSQIPHVDLRWKNILKKWLTTSEIASSHDNDVDEYGASITQHCLVCNGHHTLDYDRMAFRALYASFHVLSIQEEFVNHSILVALEDKNTTFFETISSLLDEYELLDHLDSYDGSYYPMCCAKSMWRKGLVEAMVVIDCSNLPGKLFVYDSLSEDKLEDTLDRLLHDMETESYAWVHFDWGPPCDEIDTDCESDTSDSDQDQ